METRLLESLLQVAQQGSIAAAARRQGLTPAAVGQRIQALENELEYEALQRVHRSTIVNIEHVESMRAHINGEYFLTLKGGHEVKLSRSYKDKLQYLQ